MHAPSVFTRLFGHWFGADEPAARQYGALPYTLVKGQVVVLLVTSRGTGRWIFPKGGAMEGLTPAQVAAAEAREEAGVEGSVAEQPIGTYRTSKGSGLRKIPIQVDLYPLKVDRQLDKWKEKGERYRHWVIPAEAKRLLANREMSDLVLAWASKAARNA
jgi:8-oxo-dGTP pyrophosphatase MutT (NUDIX family)